MKQQFTVSGRLPGYNELKARCWQEAARRKAEAMREVQLAAMIARIRPVRSQVTVTISCYEPNARRDVDNVTSGAGKVILDALQESGILQGDGRKYVAQVAYPPVAVDRKNPRVEISIEEDGNGELAEGSGQ